MKILVSNDDGIRAEGIVTLAQAMQTLGDVTVVAPDRNRSGASNSLTLTSPLRVQEVSPGWFSVVGTPTDCVHLALSHFCDERPDLVVSGINAGENMGEDVWYSGTIAAAMEGRFCGVQAVAFSLAGEKHAHYATAAHVAKEIVERIVKDPLPANTFISVNIPDVPISELQGYEVTRFGSREHSSGAVATHDPRGRPIFWIGPPGKEVDNGQGTDFWAIANQRVSITPIKIDVTKYEAFDQLSVWVKGFEMP